MVLTVPLDGLASACDRLGIPLFVWISRAGGRSRAVCCDPGRSIIIQAEALTSLESLMATLIEKGFDCSEGEWSTSLIEGDAQGTSFFVAAVSYRSHDGRPGLWVDAVPHQPLPGDVIAAMYEEFRSVGELAGVSLDDFIQAVEPNVVILSPEEQARFAERHLSC